MTVYIQALHQFPIADWGVAALLGFKQLGARIKFYESIEEVPVNRDVLLIGFADDTMRWFNAMGMRPPYIPTLPPTLDYFTGRLVQRTTLAESSSNASYPFFIKPYAHHKQFDARLIEKATDIQALQDQFAQEVPVLISEPVVFLAEYRAFVIDNSFVGLKHYKGDFRLFPSIDIISQAIRAFTNAPAAYGIDFGVLAGGRTVLIEVNDFWSLDNYGFDAELYARGLIRRWNQLLELSE